MATSSATGLEEQEKIYTFRLYVGDIKPSKVEVEISIKSTAGVKKFCEFQLQKHNERQHIWTESFALPPGELLYVYTVNVQHTWLKVYTKNDLIQESGDFRHLIPGVRTHRDVFRGKGLSQEQVLAGHIDHLQDIFNNVSGQKLEDSLVELKQAGIIQEDTLADTDHVISLKRWIRGNFSTSEHNLLLFLGVLSGRISDITGCDISELCLTDSSRQKLVAAIKATVTRDLSMDTIETLHSLIAKLLKRFSKTHWLYLAIDFPNIFNLVPTSKSKTLMDNGQISKPDSVLQELYRVYRDNPETLRSIIKEIPHSVISENEKARLLKELDVLDESEEEEYTVTTETFGTELQSLTWGAADEDQEDDFELCPEQQPELHSATTDLKTTDTAEKSPNGLDQHMVEEPTIEPVERKEENICHAKKMLEILEVRVVSQGELVTEEVTQMTLKTTYGPVNVKRPPVQTPGPSLPESEFSVPTPIQTQPRLVLRKPCDNTTGELDANATLNFPSPKPSLGQGLPTKGTVKFELLTNVSDIETISLCIRKGKGKDFSQDPIEWRVYQQNLFRDEVWVLAWTERNLPLNETCEYYYSIKHKPSTWRRSLIVKEDEISKVFPPHDTVRRVFHIPGDRSREKNLSKGRLLFVDSLLPHVTNETLNTFLKIAEDLEFLKKCESIPGQRKVFQWMQNLLANCTGTRNVECVLSQAQLQFLAVILGKLIQSGIHWEFNQPYKCPLAKESAFLLLNAMETFDAHKLSAVTKSTMGHLSSWLINRVGGTSLDLYHYFFPNLDADTLIEKSRIVMWPNINDEFGESSKDRIMRICSFHDTEYADDVETLLCSIVRTIDSINVFLSFVALCKGQNVAGNQFLKAAANKLDDIIRLYGLDRSPKNLLGIWQKTDSDNNTLLEVTRRYVQRILVSTWKQSDADAISVLLLLPEVYQSQEDVMKIVNNLFKANHQAILDVPAVFFKIIQSTKIMAMLNVKDQCKLFQNAISFMGPRGPITRQQITRLYDLYRLLVILHGCEHLSTQSQLKEECTSIVYNCQIPLNALVDCLKDTEYGLGECELKFVAEHVIHLLREDKKTTQEKIEQLKQVWQISGEIQVCNELELNVWMAVVDLIDTPKLSSDILETKGMTKQAEDCVKLVIQNLQLWLIVFGASGDHAIKLFKHGKCHAVIKMLVHLSQCLESGKLSFQFFETIRQNAKDLNRLFKMLDKVNEGIARSWEIASTSGLCISDNCRNRIIYLKKFTRIIERLRSTVSVNQVASLNREISRIHRETKGDSQLHLCHTRPKEYWGESLYSLLPVATEISCIGESSIFVNACRSVFEDNSIHVSSTGAGLGQIETHPTRECKPQYGDEIKRAHLTFNDVTDFARAMKCDCLPLFKEYCENLLNDNIAIKVSAVSNMLADVKNKEDLAKELSALEPFFKRQFPPKAIEAMENFVGLEVLKQKSRQLEVVFKIFEITDITDAIPKALAILTSLSQISSQETLLLHELNEAIKEVMWIDKQFEEDDWIILEQLAHCTELIKFLRPIINRDEDLRYLLDAVEEHAEQSINEGIVSDLIDVKRYVQPLLKLTDPDKAKKFAATVREIRGIGKPGKDLPKKILNCRSNVFSLKDLHDNFAKREAITKEIIRNALIKSTYSFSYDEDDESCLVVMTVHSEIGQKTYNLDDLNDLRSRALLIVNSKKTRAAQKEESQASSLPEPDLETFINIVATVNETADLFNALHNTGHFDYRCFRSVLDESRQLNTLRDDLKDHQTKWLHILDEVREKHYYLNFFHSQQLWILDQFFHENVPASITIEQVLQLVNQDITLNDSLRKYYDKPDKSNDLRSRLLCLGDSLGRIFSQESINKRRFPTDPRKEVTLENVVQRGKVFFVQLDQDSTRSIPVLLELYRNTSGSYPEASEVLFCHTDTTMEDVLLLLKRCRGASVNQRRDTLFCMVNVEMLTTETQFEMVREVKTLQKEHNDFLLAIISRGGSNHHLIDQFSRGNTHRLHGMNDSEVESYLCSGWKHVEVVTSDLPGMGKTEQILDKAASFDLEVKTIPISGPVTKESLVKEFQHVVTGETLLHVETDMMSDPDLFDTFLFELIILGRASSRNHVVCLTTQYVSVEVSNTSQNKLRNSLPTCKYFNRKSLHWNDFDDFVVSMEVNSPVQVSCHYMKALKQLTLDSNDIILAGDGVVSPLSADECRALLREQFRDRPKHEMSFSTVDTFLRIFSGQLQRLSASNFFAVRHLKEMLEEESREGLRSEFVRALRQIAEDFSARAVRMDACWDRTAVELSRFHSGSEVTAEHMAARVKQMIKWESSNHLLLLFNRQFSETVSPLYRSLDLVPQNIRKLFKRQLRRDLQDYREFDQIQLHRLLELVCRHQRIAFDRSKLKELETNYALTPDNLLKMVLIHIRVKAGIPVIVMGETGCGKTTLITYLATVCEVPFFHYNVHAGTTKEDILQQITRLVEEAEKDMKKEKTEIWAFFDEINTCDHLGLLSEVLLHHKCQGKSLPCNLVFMAACNPYRLRESISTTAGLDGKAQVDEQSKLVYRVHPLPEGMMDYVWDYGSLGRHDEAGYIQKMVEGVSDFKQVLAELLCMSQEYVRTIEKTHYCVSLRDVQRAKRLFSFFCDMLTKKPMAHVKHSVKFDSEDGEKEIRAVVLSLAHCYHSRLHKDSDRRTYRNQVAKILEKKVPRVSEKYVEDVIKKEQMDLLDQMDLPKGTAKNLALRENVFVILVCILNKIPVFVVGKPGCSKSLSMQLIMNNLRGLDSKSDYFKSLPAVFPISFQGSESSTSEGIIKVFKKAERIRHTNKTDVSPVVLLDEIGLAERSRFNPLKVLHSLLEPTVGDFPSISVVGISNWALDAAKMNRAIHLSRPEPTIEDLYETAKSIRDDIDKQHLKLVQDELLNRLAKAYYEYVNQQVPENFHGLRDYYSMVKYITTISVSDDDDDDHDKHTARIERGLLRNFGGLRKSEVDHILNVFMEKMEIIQEPEKRPTVLERIRDNLRDKLARHLMIITRGESALTILEQSFQEREHRVIFGSRFDDDDSEEYNYRILSQIILCMERGITLVLRDLESIYGSLYDMLNQNYTVVGEKQNCRIAHGPYRSPMCEVHEDFRCIVLVDEDKINFSDPPFLNRFEKQMLTFSDILSDRQVETIGILRQWMYDITSVEGAQFSPKDMFLGLHSDTLPSLVFQQSTLFKDNIPCPEELALYCKEELIRVVCPDAALRSSRSKLAHASPQKVEQFQQNYFALAQHDGLSTYIQDRIRNNKDKVGFRDVVYTHSNIHTDVSDDVKGVCSFQIEKLSHFKSERQLHSTLREFWQETHFDLFILQCTTELDAPRMLLAKCLLDQFRNEYAAIDREDKVLKHACIIVHIDRNEPRDQDAQPTWQFNYLSGWHQVTIDELASRKPTLSEVIGKTVTEVIVENHVESGTLTKEQVLWGITCLKYVIQQRDLKNCLSLTDNLTNCQEFLDLVQPQVLKAIEDTSNNDMQLGSMTSGESWQVKVACNKELLYTCSTLGAAMMEHIKCCIRLPLGKIVYFLERNCAWNGIPSSKQQPDDTCAFWKICFNSSNMFDIKSPLIPEPRGIETCVIDSKLYNFKFPFFKVFHDKIESHQEILLKQVCLLQEEHGTSEDDSQIMHNIAHYLSTAIKHTIPELECNHYLESHIDDFFKDLCLIFAGDHSVDVESAENLYFAQWLLEKKLTSSSTTLTVIEKVAWWYIAKWINEDLLATELQLLILYKDLLGKTVDDVLHPIERKMQGCTGTITKPSDVNETDDTTKPPDSHPKEKSHLNTERLVRASEDKDRVSTEPEEAVDVTPPTLECILVKVVCRSILPLQELLDNIGGLRIWERKAGLILLHAGRISTVPPILHFVRLCRDFTSVLSHYFNVDDEIVASLAEIGDSEGDPLETIDVFDFITCRIEDLMESHSDDKSLRKLQEFICMFFVRALEANPDTPVLEHILPKLFSDDGKPFAGTRPVLYRIIKADIEEYDLSENAVPVCESIINTGQINKCFPNLHLINTVLEDSPEEFDHNMAAICCDIIEELAFENLSTDRVRRILRTDDDILSTAMQSVRVLMSSTTCAIQTVCAAAFMRAFWKSVAEVLSCPFKASDFRSSGSMHILVREVNNLLSITGEGIGKKRSCSHRVYFLKTFRRHFRMYELREKCIQLHDAIPSFKDVTWQKELFSSRMVYNPMSYVKHYIEVMNVVAEWQMQNVQSNILQVIRKAEKEEPYRLALLAVITERFFLVRTTRSLQDTDKEQAKWLSERKEVKRFDSEFQTFITHLLGVEDFLGDMQVNETSEQVRIEQISVILHVACVILSSPAPGFRQYVRLTHPMKALYLPACGKPTSVLEENATATTCCKAICPSCKYVNVSKLPAPRCTMCYVCKTKIIGEYDTDKFQSSEQDQLKITGYNQAIPGKNRRCDLSLRSLSPIAYRTLRIVLHSCFMVGLSTRLTTPKKLKVSLNLSSLKTTEPSLSVQVQQFLWKNIHEDWLVLQELLQCGSDNTALFLHNLVQNAADILRSSGQETENAEVREAFEKELSYIIDNAVTLMPNCLKAFERTAFECMGSKPDGLELEIDELCPLGEPDIKGEKLSKFLTNKTSASFRHFRASVVNECSLFANEYMFLRLFLSKEDILCYVRHLRQLLDWNALVSEHLNQRIERREANRTIDEFLTSNFFDDSEDGREAKRRHFGKFQYAWNSVRDGWKLLTGRDSDFDAMSLDRPMSLCIIEGEDASSPLRQMIETLMNIQNDFLHQTLCIAASEMCPTLSFLLKDSHVSALPTVSLNEARDLVIEYTWNDYYLIFCDVNTEYGMGTLIHYDYTAIERELSRELALNKAHLVIGQTFSSFSYSDELFHACSTILIEVEAQVPQQKLPKDITNAIFRENDRKRKDLIEHLEVLLSFLKKSGGRPEQSLNSYIKEWSAILPRSFPDDLLPKPRESIKLRHVVSLYETLEDIMVNFTLSSLHNNYLTKLDDSTASQLTAKCKTIDVDRVEEILLTVRRFVFRYLRSGITTDPKCGLVKLMQRTAGKTLNCDAVAKLIPGDVTVGQVVNVIDILKKQVEQRKDLSRKIQRRVVNPPTRQKKVQISRY